MKSPTVSVIMATYNHADFVKQAIDSVLAQQGIDFEFLIADDGSSDRTRDVVASIKDPRVRFFPNTINRGACAVTNELIERASGEFIALINSDDCWTVSDKLSFQVQIMRENPGVGACFGRARFIDKDGVSIDKALLPFGAVFDQENRSQGQWLRQFFDHGNCICHPTMLIRTSCYEELGMYNNRLRQLPDFDAWIRLIKRHDIYISDREFINFRILPGENASSQGPENSIRTINEHYLIAKNFFEGVGRDQLIDGFSDLLVVKNIPTEEHLAIEKTLLFFIENKWLGKPYQLIGLLDMQSLLSSPKHHDLLVSDYGIDDRWFQQQMGEVDVLRSRAFEEIKSKTLWMRSGLHKIISTLIPAR
ncbi:MAG: glycosyltransferase [Methylobacter sp.]|nr:glycosyltransferase [Methylobacter sp.]MDP2428657.1 glycosyltransferase [Methylobacter sp.]MDP3055132.1 glycosyltransferase [Methylobacter sp.]MDP3364203.1 glycosyltransferase [Methylobacter sp.]MDZ4217443.1 glycosyltransferase [Methylobacter sp.]